MQAPGTIRRFGDLNRLPGEIAKTSDFAGTTLRLLPLRTPTKIPRTIDRIYEVSYILLICIRKRFDLNRSLPCQGLPLNIATWIFFFILQVHGAALT